MRYTRICFAFAFATMLLTAQQGSVGGPVSGFVFDSAVHGLRPVLGVPGSSLLGDPLSLSFDLASAAISPGLDSAIVSSADGGLHIFRINTGSVSERSVDGLSIVPERVVFSPSGTAAALYAAGKAQVIRGLPDAPAVAGTLDLGATPSALALSDDGANLLFAAGGAIQLLGPGGSRKVMEAGDGALVAFASAGADAAVLDPSGAGVVFVHDLAGASVQSVLAAPDDDTASAVGVAFSADGHKLFLASASAQSVVSFDVQTGDRTAFACNCTPTGLNAMGRLLRLNEIASGPLWLFDPGADQPRIVFVPALAAAN